MATDSLLLTDLLRLDARSPGLDRVTEIAALRVGGVEAPDAAQVAGLLRDFDRGELAGALAEMLQIDLTKLMAEAWVRARKVREALRDSIAQPDAERSVELSSHTLEATQQPRLVLSFAGADWCQIDFKLKFSVVLKSATLQLRGGTLVALRLGKPAAKAKLECEGVELKEFARELALAPEYRLATPLPLQRFAARPAA